MGDNDEIQLPSTVEEYQKALREAFKEGNRTTPLFSNTLEAEARKRFPIWKKVPRVVELPTAGWWAGADPMGNGDIRFFRHERDARAFDRSARGDLTWIEGGDRVVVADLLANPYTYEEE